MASHNNYTSGFDDFKTPSSVWGDILEFIPDKEIWCPFYFKGDHTLSEFKNIIHTDEDFFETNKGEIVIDNPPFSTKKQVLQRLKDLEKPFILILPVSTITYQYFQNIFKGDNIQIIIPKKRIKFIDNKSSAPFDCLYVCYKVGLDKDINILN